MIRRYLAIFVAFALCCGQAKAAYIGAVTQFAVVVGGANGALGSVTPGTAGISLTSQGASANPAFVVCLVVGGCTGLATITAHGVMIGEGTANVATAGPGATAGVPLVSGGSSADPSFTTAVVAGGGTGATTFTIHGVLIGETTGAIVATAAGASGVPLIGQGAADPIFGTATVAGGGTGATTLTAHGVLIGEGTGAVVASAAGTASQLLASGGASVDPGYVNLSTLLTAGTGISLSGTTNVTITNTGSAGGPVATNLLTAAGPFTLSATYNTMNISRMGTPAAATYNLPSAVTAGNGFVGCLMDDTTNFATNQATLKSPTSGNINGVTGATGIPLSLIARQVQCYESDGTNWFLM